MRSVLTITAAVLLATVSAGTAMGQNFRQRSDDNSSFNRGDSFSSHRSDSGNQPDSSGYGRRDFGNRDNSSFGSQSSFGSRDAHDLGAHASNSFTQPAMPKSSGLFTAKPLPADLELLLTRSIFSRDHRAVAAASDSPRKPPAFNSEVAKLIFDGAMREGDHFVAFIEDTGSSKSHQWVSIGQALTANGGQINDITLDHIVVEKSGVVREIGVGENLESGKRLPSPPASASVTAGSGSNLSGARPNSSVGSNAPTATASTTGTATDEDVADMMRRRRVQELGQ